MEKAQVDVTAIALGDQTWLGSTFLILSSNTAIHRICRSLHERQMHLLTLTDCVPGSSESAAARKVSPGRVIPKVSMGQMCPGKQVKPEASRAHALTHHMRAEAEELRTSKGTASRERGSSRCDSHGTSEALWHPRHMHCLITRGLRLRS